MPGSSLGADPRVAANLMCPNQADESPCSSLDAAHLIAGWSSHRPMRRLLLVVPHQELGRRRPLRRGQGELLGRGEVRLHCNPREVRGGQQLDRDAFRRRSLLRWGCCSSPAGWVQTHPRLAMSGLGSRRVASACFQRRDSDATASALVRRAKQRAIGPRGGRPSAFNSGAISRSPRASAPARSVAANRRTPRVGGCSSSELGST